MTKKILRKALADHKQRVAARNAERIVVANYPYSHNPYIAHDPVEDCFPGCTHFGSLDQNDVAASNEPR